MNLPENIATVSIVDMVPIEDLRLWDQNPRHNDHAVDILAKNIAKYGMNVPLVINDRGEVIAGNTRLKACKQLGLTAVPCVRANHLTPRQQQAYNVADNKLSEIASWDDPLLRDIVSEQIEVLGDAWDAEHLGMKQSDVDLLLNGWEPDGSAQDVAPNDGTAPGRVVITCPVELVDELKASIQKFLEHEGLHGVSFR